MKFNYGILLALFALLIQLVAYSWASAKDPFPMVTLPVHPKAINPQSQVNNPAQGAKSVAFRIKMPFPAEELTTFYDREFKKMGYRRYTEDGGSSFQWEKFNPKSGKWEETGKVPARYTAVWVDPKHSVRIWLYVAYKYDGKDKSWEDHPIVSVNMAEFFKLQK